MKLYEATEALAIVEQWLDEAGGEFTPEIESVLNDAKMQFNEKVEKVALKIRELQAQEEVVRAEANRLTGRARTLANSADSLKRYLEREMQAAGVDKVKGTLVSVSVQNNRPSVRVNGTEEEQQVMLETLYDFGKPYVKVVPQTFVLDKTTLLDTIKADEEELTRLRAALGGLLDVVTTRSLRIR